MNHSCGVSDALIINDKGSIRSRNKERRKERSAVNEV